MGRTTYGGDSMTGPAEIVRKGIGHSSCLLAQRPGMGVMLNP